MEESNVIWATGYESDFGWIDLPLFGKTAGSPTSPGVVSLHPGLYFLGNLFLYSPTSALLGGIGRDAKYVVSHLASQRRSRISAQV